MPPKYHIFKTWPQTTIKPGETPYSHPLLKGGRGYVVVFSVQEEDMLKVRNLGRKSLEEVVKKLEELGLSLKAQED